MELAIILALDVLNGAASLVLLCLGLAIIFGMMKIINLAHGEFVMLGAYATVISANAGVNIWIAMLVVAPVFVGLVGIVVERCLIRFLYGRLVDTMLATWGLSLFIVGLVTTIYGNTIKGVPTPLGGFSIGEYKSSYYTLFLVAAALIMLALIFGMLRYTGADTTLSLSMGGADNTLQGSQTIPRSFLGNPAQAYTFPDTNKNSTVYVTLSGDHAFNDDLQLSGNLYYRHFRNTNLSSNVSEDFGSIGVDGTANTVQSNNALSIISTDSYGGSLQLTRTSTIAGMENQLVVGAAADFANSGYTQATQEAFFTDARASVGLGGFTQTTNAKTRNANLGVYFNDTLSLSKQWTLTLAGRYNWARAVINDASGTQPLLDGNHTFSRFNPAIGFTYSPGRLYTFYGDYSESNRAPTSIELGCADPDFPCNLPNALVSDPPLDQVVSRTVEAGIRSRLEGRLQWSAGFFRGQNSNDLLFIASEQTGFGYFTNFGKTIRKGIEASIDYQRHPFDLSADYTFLTATYGSSGEVDGSINSSNNAAQDGFKGLEGDITISPGNHLPQTPQHIFKFNADYKPTSKAAVLFNITSASGTFARGNENNRHKPDGTYYLGVGSTDAYAIANLGARYQLTQNLQLFVQMNNLFNNHYATAAQLGATPYDANGVFTPRPFPSVQYDGDTQYPLRNTTFLSPGAPFTVFGGLRISFHL